MSEEASYYLRFISFFIDVATETALQVVNHCTNKDVETHLNSNKTKLILRKLLQDKELTKTQYNLVSAQVPKPDNFDLSLLITLLCNSDLLPPPTKGWDNPPGITDLSISADILRLRIIRNRVVARRTRAALPENEFERLWNELEESLLRITFVTAPGTVEELNSKIKRYRCRTLDAQNDQKYLQKLEEWWGNCEEISKLQEKVEELIQKCNEFELFFRHRQDEYSFYVRLLFEGGQLVLSKFLNKQILEQGHDLRSLLLENKEVLEDIPCNQQMPKPLFHTDSTGTALVNTDTDSWDILVLAHVIETILKPKNMKAINMIKDARINFEETALMSVNNHERFSSCCEDLVHAIRTLSSSLDKDIQEKCDEQIQNYRTISATTDLNDYLSQLKFHGAGIKTMSDVYKETLEKLKASIKEMVEADICFKNDHVLELKMSTPDDTEKKRVVENMLVTVWQDALKNAENPNEFEAVRREVDRILADIRNMQGVSVLQSDCRRVPVEIAYDPYKLNLYNKAIQKGKETEMILRINVIGNCGQGKTSLVRSLIGQSSEGVTSTNGIDISRYICKRSEDGLVSANQCENDSQDKMNRIAAVATKIRTSETRAMPVNPSSSENAVKDIDERSAENISRINDIESTKDSEFDYLKANTEQSTGSRKGANVVQVMHERKPINKMPCSDQELKEFSAALDKQKDGSEHLLDIWDFGGQYIFYATHTLFHCKDALYLLVFDLTSPLKEIVRDEHFPNETGEKNMSYFAKFWVESIDAYTGPGTKVILIGTHKDKLENPDKMKEDYFEAVRSLFDSLDVTDENPLSNHFQPEDFAVDNSNSPDSGIRELLAFILEKHQELVKTVEIPARWIPLEKALHDEREKKIITFDDVLKINKTMNYPLDDEDQVKLFLTYHHDKGRVFYFDDGQPSDPIVLDPTFLIDAFKCIITSEQFVKKTDVRAEWIKLKRDGILTEKLIDKVWTQNEDFKQHKDVLLTFLSKHNVVSQVVDRQSSKKTVKGEAVYVVPSMLRDFKHAPDKLKLFLEKKRQTQLRFLLKFTRPSVAQTVFYRIAAAMFGIWPIVNCCKTMLFFENMCVFEVLQTTECKSTNHAVVIECVQEFGSIELRVVPLSQGNFRRDVADQLRRYVESSVQAEFRILTRSYLDNEKPYVRAYRCNHEDHPAGSGSNTIKELNENEDIRCPDNRTHDNNFFRNAKEEWFIGDSDETSYPKLQLTAQHLSLLAQAIGNNWQLLGAALGVKQTAMDHIHGDNNTTCMKIYHMLLKWKNSDVSEKATLDAFIDVVKKCPKVHVEWDELRNIRDEFCRKSNKAEPC